MTQNKTKTHGLTNGNLFKIEHINCHRTKQNKYLEEK